MDQSTPNSSFPTASPSPRRAGWRRWIVPIGLIVLGALITSYPLWPKLQYAIAKPTPTLPYLTKLGTTGNLNPAVTFRGLPVVENKPVPKDNRLVIPSINVDMPILEGSNQRVLDRGGIWHLPKTSDPLKGGNMVISGHRWMYLPPSSRTLYLLDKVQDGEPVIVYWQGQEYDYRISHHEVVNPNRVDILNPTTEPRLTIFTCTPLFSTKQRLVLFGELIS
ncbi:MAG: class E sortase [Candidatus Kerfeldbacteria bacterium]|nr:class E sortase [Candidatus Kerfeldbacteria bacterium]